MKSIKLSILCLIISINSFSQLTYMPDDAFEQCVEATIPGAISGNNPNDNYVNTAAIQAAWSLGFTPSNTPSAMINDFTGLSDFTNLDVITFQSMNMPSINLSMLSGAAYHTIVNVSHCNNLTTLTLPVNKIGLSLAYNTMLQNVIFQPSNILNGIGITGNNSLTSIDISNTSGVKPGSTLQIYDNPVLTCLKLDNGQCSNWGTASHTGNGYININDPWSEYGGSLFCVQVDNPAYCEISSAWSYGPAGIPNTYYYSTNCGCVASIDEEITDEVSISPNPATDKITITTAIDKIGYTYTILDNVGKAVYTSKAESLETVIDLQDLLPGLYFFKLENTREILKIIKQ